MSIKQLENIQSDYKTIIDDVVNEFYIPTLANSVIYKRGTGYFSSNVLLQISKGLGAFADNKGKMQLLISPQLDINDYKAIELGYNKKEYLEQKLINDFDFNIDFFQKEDRFGMLSYLIETGILEIKIVYLEKNNDKAIYHEKIGIMKDDDNNIIVFSGSPNFTYSGLNTNFEHLMVFRSWINPENLSRCIQNELFFDNLRNGKQKGLITIDFPSVIRNKLIKYQKNTTNKDFRNIDKMLQDYLFVLNNKPKEPYLNENISLRDYQNLAIKNWEKQNFCGVFDMATGTGKTITGAGAIAHLFAIKKRLFVIIVCPFIHLVDQWRSELKDNLQIDPIICYGQQNNYITKLNRSFTKFRQKRSNFECLIFSNATFRKAEIQKLIDQNIQNTLLLVDEAHNFGSQQLKECLKKNYPYRLALSATFERNHDNEGTKALYDFFGRKCIEYTLKTAIEKGVLTPYYYHPVIVNLTEDELDSYLELSKKIGKISQSTDELTDYKKQLLIKRARIIAGAKNKLEKLNEIIKPYVKDNNLLIYCGAINYNTEGYLQNDDTGKKQIDKVIKNLFKNYGMICSKFTSEEDTETRTQTLNAFKNNVVQALVAIKCLDEGINIPSIKTAFILASSSNPKEYIQRRGRVLRKYPGKTHAEIYDFITLPYPANKKINFNSPTIKYEQALIKKELIRMQDFIDISNNISENNEILKEIKVQYGMYNINLEDDDYE